MGTTTTEVLSTLKAVHKWVSIEGPEAFIYCPFCGSDRMSVHWMEDSKYGFFKCWACEEHGSVFGKKGREFIMGGKQLHFDWGDVDAEEEVDDRTPVCEDFPDWHGGAGTLDLRDAVARLPEEWAPVEAYLRRRLRDEYDVIFKDMADTWLVQYVPLSEGRTMGRVFPTGGSLCFQVLSADGTGAVGWHCRLAGPDPSRMPVDEALAKGYVVVNGKVRTPKCFTAPHWKKDDHLYGLRQAWEAKGTDDATRNGPGGLVVVVEGPMDVHAVGPSAVCGLGKGLSTLQVAMLKAAFKSGLIVLLGDSDEPGREAQGKLVAELNRVRKPADPEILEVHLQGYKDPGEAGRRESWRQIAAAAKAKGIDLRKYKFRLPDGADPL